MQNQGDQTDEYRNKLQIDDKLPPEHIGKALSLARNVTGQTFPVTKPEE
jgi:hypothetical protein